MTVVRMSGVRKAFAGVPVLHGVDLDVRAGEVLALAGENGAGKSTLMKVLAGIHAPDAGDVVVDGATVTAFSPAAARDLGVAIVHQELSLAPNLTVAENLALGREPRRGLALDRRAARERAAALLERVGSRFPADRRVARLSTAERQLVEIARALSDDPCVLILDEPTASLSEAEAQRLFEIVCALRERGLAIVYITHRMEEIERLADRVTVMRDGRVIETLDSFDPDAIVARMVGRPLSNLYERRPAGDGPVRLRVRGLTDGGRIGPADFEVRGGEILGFAGLIGAGRTELLRLLFGADRGTGSIEVDGVPATIGSPRDALDAGLAFVPESRKDEGLLLNLSIAQNIALASLDGWILNRRAIAEAAQAHAEALDLRARSVHQSVAELSGGNQQKALLARWLETSPRVLLLDEPTRGVDIGAKAAIYHLMGELAARGVAIVFVSSELPELLAMSHRVAVVRDGRIVADLEAPDEETVMRHATGTAPQEVLA
jgi:ribose transport system ATP-binding protein